MKTSIKKIAIVASVIFFVGFATYALAGRGGYGYHMGGGYGNGYHMGYGNGNHMGYGQMGYGSGNHMGYNGQMGYGNGYHMGFNGNHMWDQLTDAERDQMIKDMDRFHNDNFNGRRFFQDNAEKNEKNSK